jgi:hypothetical protein
MTELLSWVYIALALGLSALGVLALLRVGILRLEMRVGIDRDGLPIGHKCPAWHAPDLDGNPRSVPGDGRWQILVFADHSLQSFPDVIEGIARLGAGDPDVEVLVLSSASPELSARLPRVGVTCPVVCVDPSFYRRHDVRAMPFIFVLDADGVVRATGLASTSLAMFTLLRLGRNRVIDASSSELPARTMVAT